MISAWWTMRSMRVVAIAALGKMFGQSTRAEYGDKNHVTTFRPS